MLLHVFKSRKSLNAKYLNDTFSVKQINYSMRQVLKWVQPQRKTTTVGLKKSNIWEPSCGMTVLYYVKNCGQRTFLHLNALSMTQSEMSSHMTIFSIHENPHMPLLFLFFLLAVIMFSPSFAESRFLYVFFFYWIRNDFMRPLHRPLVYIYQNFMFVCIYIALHIFCNRVSILTIGWCFCCEYDWK